MCHTHNGQQKQIIPKMSLRSRQQQVLPHLGHWGQSATKGGNLRHKAACRGQPLQGSLFWRWDLIIYEDQPRADYGVRTYDTTFNLVKSHAKMVSHLQASQPPAATCKLQCWVSADTGNRWDFTTNSTSRERACQQSTPRSVYMWGQQHATIRLAIG